MSLKKTARYKFTVRFKFTALHKPPTKAAVRAWVLNVFKSRYGTHYDVPQQFPRKTVIGPPLQDAEILMSVTHAKGK